MSTQVTELLAKGSPTIVLDKAVVDSVFAEVRAQDDFTKFRHEGFRLVSETNPVLLPFFKNVFNFMHRLRGEQRAYQALTGLLITQRIISKCATGPLPTHSVVDIQQKVDAFMTRLKDEFDVSASDGSADSTPSEQGTDIEMVLDHFSNPAGRTTAEFLLHLYDPYIAQ